MLLYSIYDQTVDLFEEKRHFGRLHFSQCVVLDCNETVTEGAVVYVCFGKSSRVGGKSERENKHLIQLKLLSSTLNWQLHDEFSVISGAVFIS